MLEADRGGVDPRRWDGLREDRVLGLILAAAFLLRVLSVLVLNRAGLTSAGYEHWQPAWSLYKGQGFSFDWYGLFPHPVPSSFLPPLYSWILYLALKATAGREHAAMLLAQSLNVLLGTATVFLVARIARLTWISSPAPARSGKGPGIGLPAGPPSEERGTSPGHWLRQRPHLPAAALWAVYPPALGHVAQAQTQILETFLLLLLTCLVLRRMTSVTGPSGSPPRRAAGILAGVVLGLLLLARPSSGVIWAVWCVLILWPGKRRRLVLPFVALASLVALLVVTPWTVRNYRLQGRLVPIASNGGFNFFLGHGPYGGGDIPPLAFLFRRMPKAEQDEWRSLTEVERDRRLYRLGLQNDLKDPKGALLRTWRRFVSFVFFRSYLFAAYPIWLSALFVISYALLLIPFLLALPRCRGPGCALCLSAIGATFLVGLAYVVSMRFRATVEPLMAVVGAGSFVPRNRAERASRRSQSRGHPGARR